MIEDRLDLQVIIPCRNEEDQIGRCLDALLLQNQGVLAGSIIVVDNGSTDRTVQIIKDYGDRVHLLSLPNANISELRNFGAQATRKAWLAFVDADIEVTPNWLNAISTRIGIISQDLECSKKTLFGSHCKIPNNPTWIERAWYEQLDFKYQAAPRYLNSGNMIVNHNIFDKVGGFNKKYSTAEDVKLCDDIRAAGGIIIYDRRVAAIHHGYPKTLKMFFRRERWHGMGMAGSLLQPWKSKPLMLAIYNLIFLFLFILSLFIFKGQQFHLLPLFLFIAFAPLVPIAWKRGGKSLYNKFLLIILYWVYGWARAASLIDIIIAFVNKSRTKVLLEL